MEGLFVSYHSKKSEIDILASVSSKGESKEVMEGDSNNLPDDMWTILSSKLKNTKA